jgi:two-component system, sensor histidine kinase LadS
MKTAFFFFFWITIIPVLAMDTLVVSDKRVDYMPQGTQYEMFEDPSGLVSTDQILSDSIQQLFNAPLSPGAYTNKNLNTTYWVRFSIKRGSENKFWVMELVDPHIQSIDVYEYHHGKMEPVSARTGYDYSFLSKDFFYKNYLYNLDLSDGKGHIYYFRFKSNVYNSFVVKVRSPEYFVSYSLTEYFLLGFYYGILMIMAIYNLFIFFSVKERAYIFYVLYVIACGFNSMNEDGLGFQFLWPNQPWFNIISMRAVPLFLMLAFTLYSTSFLELGKREPLMNKIMYSLVGFYVLIFSINGIFFEFSGNTQALYLLPFGFIYFVAIRVMMKGYKPARYFLLGYSFILISFIVFYLRTNGLEVLGHFFYVYSFNYGFILEVVILSFALGERLKEGKKEKENAQRIAIEQLQEKERYKDKLNKELESKVEERTFELKQANEEIHRMNQFLEQHNLKLQEDVKHISKERIMQREVSFDEFKLTYPNEEACFQFLSDLKWAKSYQCRKCGNDKFSLMNNLARRCNKCKYIESPTAFTIFHSLKFSILDAFYMLFLVNTRKDITAEELSRTIHLSEKSCASFKRKMLLAEKSMKGKAKDKSGWERLISYYEEE